MRLIDADKLLEMIEERIEESGKHRMAVLAEELIDVINDYAEDYEVEQVKHGRWIHHSGMNSKCSCCGRYFPVAEFEQRPFDVNFCIHCGARMDGKERENDDKM